MDIAAMIMYVLLGIFGLFVVISALIGLGRGLKKTVASTAVIVTSALIAYLITALAFKPNPNKVGFIAQMIFDLMKGSEFGELLAIQGVRDAMSFYIYMITAPFIFVLLFVLIRLILGITMRIVLKYIPIMNNIPKVAKKLGGVGVGLVNGAVLFLILFMPLLGTVDVVSAAINDIGALAQTPAPEQTVESKVEVLAAEVGTSEPQITDYLDAVTSKGIGKVALGCGGRLMYDSVSSTRYYGERVVLRNEIDVVIDMASGLTSMGSGGDSMVGAIDAVVSGVDRSPIVAGFASDVMSEMATSWLEGEKFMGIEKISLGEMIDPMFDTVLQILASEDRDHVADDLKSISGFLHAASDIGLLGGSNGGNVLDSFGEAGTITHLLESIEGNDRMLPLIDELNTTCIKLFADNLGFFNTREDLYESLITELAGYVNQYNGGMLNKGEATEAISATITKHGIDLSKEEMNTLVEALLREYDQVHTDMTDRIKDFFRLYSAVAGSTLVENSDDTLVADGVALNTYYTYNYKSSQAYLLAKAGVSIGDAATITSAENIKTVLITLDDLMNVIVKYGDVADRHAETEQIDAIMVAMIQAFQNMEDDSFNASKMMAEMGHVLDKMNYSAVFGDITDSFLTAIMQSEKVADSIGLNIVEMTDFANKLNAGRTENTGYEQISSTVANTFDVLENMDDEAVKKDKVQELMKDLTPETAKIMQDIATPSLMQSYGVKEENAQKSSNTVSTLFGNMSNYTTLHPQGDMSDEEYKEAISHEAEAVDKILTLAIKVNERTDKKKEIFNAEETTGSLNMSAYDMVDLLATSMVAEDTINDMVIGTETTPGGFDPVGASKGLLANDKAQLAEALESYGEDNKDVEGIEEKLANIGAFFGVQYGE